MPNISVIVLTFNSIKYIESCLNSIFSQGCNDVEVVVVDNGSTDGTVHFIKENFNKVILVENKKNLGACKARNQGIEISCGEWILTLDCDVVLEAGFLKKMLNLTEDLQDYIGMIQPKILQEDRKTIYSVGIYLSWLKRFFDIGKGKRDNKKFDQINHVFGVCSAAALYRRKMLESILEATGYYDDRFFFLVEDVDLACRAQSQGWKALFYPHAICYHSGNGSNMSKELRQYLCWRNRWLLLRKLRLKKIRLIMVFFMYDFPRTFFHFFTNVYIRNSILKKETFKETLI